MFGLCVGDTDGARVGFAVGLSVGRHDGLWLGAVLELGVGKLHTTSSTFGTTSSKSAKLNELAEMLCVLVSNDKQSTVLESHEPTEIASTSTRCVSRVDFLAQASESGGPSASKTTTLPT